MDSITRSPSSSVLKLGMAFLFALATLAPSAASANTLRYWGRAGTLCYPNSSTCRNLSQSELSSDMQTMELPIAIDDTCPGNLACGLSDTQTWKLWHWNGASTYQNVVPTRGVTFGTNDPAYQPPPALAGRCTQSSVGHFQCVVGTGGPWGSWVLTLYYYN